MKGKEKCEFLKGIRKRMAEANGIPYEPRECTYEGECSGTCPFCEKEAAELLAKLRKKEAEGAEIKTDLLSIEAIESIHRDPESIPYHLWDALVTPSICAEAYEETKRQWEESERNRIMQTEQLPGSLVNACDEELSKRDYPCLLQEEDLYRSIKEQKEESLFRKIMK